EAIRSPLRALLRRSVLSALGIEIRQYAKAGYLAPAQILYPLCLGQPKHSQASYTNARWLTYLPSLPGLTRQSIALRKCFFFRWMRGSGRGVTLLLVLPIAEEALELGAHARCNVIAFEGVSDIGREKTHLRAAIEGPSFEFQSVKRLCSREFDHRVGELDFAA